jgi:rod shape-determining protein MreC
MAGRIILVLTLLFLGLWQLEQFRERTLTIVNHLREKVVKEGKGIEEAVSSYLNAAREVRELERKNRELELKVAQLSAQLATASQLKYFKVIEKPYLRFTEVIGYANLPSFTRVFLDYDGPISRPKGLIYNGYSAGIAVRNVGGSCLALLNSDPQTSYTVVIGPNRIPGIFYGRQFIVKYIPLFKKIKVGDEVVTSGVDKIFYPGVKVGKVVEVESTKLYQVAKIAPYYHSLTPSYFYLVDFKKGEFERYFPPSEFNSTEEANTTADLNSTGEKNGTLSTPIMLKSVKSTN